MIEIVLYVPLPDLGVLLYSNLSDSAYLFEEWTPMFGWNIWNYGSGPIFAVRGFE